MKVSKCTFIHQGKRLYQTILKSIYKYLNYGPDKLGQLHSRLHTLIYTKVATSLNHHKQACQKKGITPFPKQALVFTCLKCKSIEKHNEQFLLFPQSFLPDWRTFCHLHQTQNCCLQPLSVWKSLKFVIWKRVKVKH